MNPLAADPDPVPAHSPDLREELRGRQIFVTGGTGFIGSHVCRALIQAGHSIICLKRKTSSLDRCVDFRERAQWVDHDSGSWAQAVIASKPRALIHCAWAGVTAAERDDWKIQGENIALFLELLRVAEAAGVKQFIALGSQAEYGPIQGRVNEAHPCRPATAYGIAKLACLALLEGFARQRKMSHAWLRLFSIYGPGEGSQWFIPSLVRQMKAGQAPQLTGCEQRYDYLHVHDLASAVLAVLRRPGSGGVFNLSSNASMPLKQVVQLIKESAGGRVEPVFGALPYRPGQSMHVEGDSTRFYETFAFTPQVTIVEGLRALAKETATT
jgi:nucleoside-diphosphate-sugar epimerase